MNENEPIATIVDDIEMNIQTGPFNNGEYENLRKQIKEKKAPGSVGTTSEVLKQCEVNDTVLTFANRILIDN